MKDLSDRSHDQPREVSIMAKIRSNRVYHRHRSVWSVLPHLQLLSLGGTSVLDPSYSESVGRIFHRDEPRLFQFDSIRQCYTSDTSSDQHRCVDSTHQHRQKPNLLTPEAFLKQILR